MRGINAFAGIRTFPEDFLIYLLDLDFYYDLNNKNNQDTTRKVTP
jgi:hypothetical protein